MIIRFVPPKFEGHNVLVVRSEVRESARERTRIRAWPAGSWRTSARMERSARSTSWKKNTKSAAALIALGGFLSLSLWLGDELWNLSAYWPTSGIGFGATVGVLLPITFTASKRSFRRVSSDPCLLHGPQPGRHHSIDSRMRSSVRRPILLIVGLLST